MFNGNRGPPWSRQSSVLLTVRVEPWPWLSGWTAPRVPATLCRDRVRISTEESLHLSGGALGTRLLSNEKQTAGLLNFATQTSEFYVFWTRVRLETTAVWGNTVIKHFNQN
jgi:hypothetical protein